MPDDDKPKDDTKDEKKPEGEDTPPASPAPAPAHGHHDVGEAIDKMSHTVEAQLGMFEGLFTRPMIVFGIMLGLLLQFLAATLLNFNWHLDVSQVISNLGILIMLIVLLGGALLNDKLDPYVRFGMFFVAAFIGGFNQIVYTGSP